MKTIFVATDFSPAAHNACMHGAELTRAFNARMILFNAYQQVPVAVTETPAIITSEDMQKLVREQLEMEVHKIKRSAPATIETACNEGFATGGILQAAKEHKADLIIAGMKGSGKGIRKVLGSTVTALMRKTTIPLMVVPEEAHYKRLDTIALANESDAEPDTDPHLLDSLREIGERFQSKLYLVRVAKNKFREMYEVFNRPFKLTRMVRTLDPVYESMEGKDIPQALNAFIDFYDINMLAMLPHKHSLLERLFTRSATQSMIFDIHIPLLILPDLHVKKKSAEPSDREALL